MSLLFLLPGLALPTLIGWLVLRLLEHRHPVLTSGERWLLGFVCGTTFTMFTTFLFHTIGLLRFTVWGFLSVQLLLAAILTGVFFFLKLPTSHFQLPTSKTSSWSPLTKILVVTLTLWTILKIAGGIVMLTGTPVYHDDVFNNWNLRGKIFFETNRLTLTVPLGNETFSNDGISSYPPTVPMVKTWLALLNGEWHEGLVNSIHILWYIATTALLFFVLRRLIGFLWALIGAYVLSSLPLYLIHGSTAYADVFLSLHLLIPLLLLVVAASQQDSARRISSLRLSALFTGLLVFTKNEAILLYLPPLLLCVVILVLTDVYQKRLSRKQAMNVLLCYLGFLALILLPWLTFKYLHNLPFGNAKAVSGFNVGWQPGVLYALWVNTFFEGNWIFLWLVFIGLTLLKWRTVLRFPLLLPTLFLYIVLGEQFVLYLFTSLSEEALKQTGLARGLVHLAPLTVFVTTMLLHRAWSQVTTSEKFDKLTTSKL